MNATQRQRFNSLSALITEMDPLTPLQDFYTSLHNHARQATPNSDDIKELSQEFTGYCHGTGADGKLQAGRTVVIAVDGYMISLRLQYQDGDLALPFISVLFWAVGKGVVGKLVYRDLLLFQLIWVQLTAITMDGLA